MRSSSKQQGFTIVETLVAITVLMIAIAGPLVVASKGLSGAAASKDQMIASYLAEESMEVVKNQRDNNIYTGALSWLNGFGNCSNSAPCDASAIDTPNFLLYSAGAPVPLNLTDLTANGYYSHTSGGMVTPFTRYFYLSKPNAPTIACDYSTMDECTVTVVVNWNEGTVPYGVTVSSEITKISR
jgi:type II secretory pathway pseudopilin PulG